MGGRPQPALDDPRGRLCGAAVITCRLAIAALAVALPLLAADSAMACSCAPRDPGTSIQESDGVFIGRLLAVRVVDPPAEGEPVGSGDPTDYIYRVGRVYNGGPGLRRGRRVRVRSVRSEATCGLPRGRGRLYGLFVERRGGRWHGNLCNTVPPAELRAAEGDGASIHPTVLLRCDLKT